MFKLVAEILTQPNLKTTPIVGAAGVASSLSLHETAAALAGLGTFVCMLVQSYIAIQKYRNTACVRKDCTQRIEP